jgi:hypothetical protein
MFGAISSNYKCQTLKKHAMQRCMIGRDFIETCPGTNHRSVEETVGSRQMVVSLGFRKNSQYIPAQLLTIQWIIRLKEWTLLTYKLLFSTKTCLPTIVGVAGQKFRCNA